MELLWKQLLHVISQLGQQAQSLIQLARRQREAIVQEKIQSLGEIVIEQEEVLHAFQQLEQEREVLVREVRQELRLDVSAPTLASLLPMVPVQWGNDYRQAAERLRRDLDEMKRENAINQQLLKQSQKFTAWLLAYLATPEGAAPLYTHEGASQPTAYYHFVNQTL